MKERPILFSAPMVRALLAGTKTQTRRECKFTSGGHLKEVNGHRRWHRADPDAILACPYGRPGERLWVRESWRYCCAQMSPHCVATIEYKADGAKRNIAVKPEQLPQPRPENGEGWDERMRYLEKWWAMGRPSIHMPRWASRITLEVTGVRIERLQEISDADAWSEGIDQNEALSMGCTDMAAVAAFSALSESINGPDSWDANPWVWVVEFKRITPA